MLKIMSIFGTRPETSKMAPVIKELESRDNIQSIVCVTAQHRELLDQMLEIFDISPDYDLNIMKKRQMLVDVMTSALAGLVEVMNEEKPDMVLVHGDTTTTFAGALAAFYTNTKVGHVEAGLRSYDKYQPYPEEINRKLTTSLADLYFAPTHLSKENLVKENIDTDIIFVTGNTAVDVPKSTVKKDYIFDLDLLNNIDFTKKIIPVTTHRSENIGKPLKDIAEAIKSLAQTNHDVIFIYALHPNPAVREIVMPIVENIPNIIVTEPIGMVDLHNLMSRSYLVLTDSGGIQEEGSAMSVPVVVLRNVTERPEGLHTGILKLAGTEYSSIVNIVNELLNNAEIYSAMKKSKNPYGDGFAAKRIVDTILYYFKETSDKPDEFQS